MDNIRIDARMALARYESSVAAYGNEAHFSIKNVHDVRAYIDHLESALREIAAASKIIAKGEDMETALKVMLASYQNIARAALGEKKDVG